VRCILLGDAALLAQTAHDIDPAMRGRLSIQAWRNSGLPHFPPDCLTVIDCPVAEPVRPGVLDARNGRAVLERWTGRAGRTGRRFAAIVTAPLQKGTINDAGVAFTGHTEYLAEVRHAGGDDAGRRRCAPSARGAGHHAPGAEGRAGRDHRRQPGAHAGHPAGRPARQVRHRQPRILVTGLNPHAGENGYLGREEIEVITPALEAARARGIDAAARIRPTRCSSPVPGAGRLRAGHVPRPGPAGAEVRQFRPWHQHHARPALIRTSVDHGTALDLAAGLGHADHGSMLVAIRAAADMARRQQNMGR
jgi:4-hydroxythreonine-4-phosphate dehydrogenase